MEIGFLGLGQMGLPMARHLQAGGHAVTGCDLRPDRRALAENAGVTTTADTSELIDLPVLILCLPDGAALRRALLDTGLLAAGLKAGSLVIDTSTVDHATALAIGDALEGRGVAFVDAPVSGMVARAESGTLTVMCGGSDEAFARAEPLLACFADKILHMGGQGAGQLTKLVNQLLYNINMAAVAEILPFAVSLGLDAEQVAQVVNSGTGRSHASEFFLPRILEGRFGGSYPLEAAYKDMVAAADISAREALPLPVLAAATATYQQALRHGLGAEGKGAMIKVFEELFDVQVRNDSDPKG
ncbi:MAG: NAD(P)-dependent oxidoreductase [Pseudomonadota bacterium]